MDGFLYEERVVFVEGDFIFVASVLEDGFFVGDDDTGDELGLARGPVEKYTVVDT